MEFHRSIKQQASSSLLYKCPLEIRERIWRQVFKSDHLLQPYSIIEAYQIQKKNSQTTISKFKAQLNLSGQVLSSCQQIYKECHPILYGENTIVFHMNRAGKVNVLGNCLMLENADRPLDVATRINFTISAQDSLPRSRVINFDYWT